MKPVEPRIKRISESEMSDNEQIDESEISIFAYDTFVINFGILLCVDFVFRFLVDLNCFCQFVDRYTNHKYSYCQK